MRVMQHQHKYMLSPIRRKELAKIAAALLMKLKRELREVCDIFILKLSMKIYFKKCGKSACSLIFVVPI